jgi:dTMP kinase
MARGRLITVEGLDGAGKTTLVAALAEALGERDREVTVLREPGGVEISERIRALVKDPELSMDPRAEALLYAAARAQLVAERLEPLLAAGGWVLLDRFVDSSLAYQGGGRRLGVNEVRTLNRFATGGLEPDKLARLEAKWPHVTTIVGDATRLELPERSFDHALCTFLVHHLDDEGVAGLTAGLRRAVRETVLLIDPLRVEGRLRSRLLWSIDAGAYPRSAEELLGALEQDFVIEHEERFAVHHAYVLCVARPRPARSSLSALAEDEELLRAVIPGGG